MPDLEFGEHLKVKENAMPAIAQIRDHLEDGVIAIVKHPPDSCCQIGFNAVPVARSKLPDQGFHKIGMIEDIEVTVEIGLLPSIETDILLGFDQEAGYLVAYVNQ
ncbi:MAG: hypothetical protein VB913_00310 [Rhodospirillales bacterium]|jgi:hypothetical protein